MKLQWEERRLLRSTCRLVADSSPTSCTTHLSSLLVRSTHLFNVPIFFLAWRLKPPWPTLYLTYLGTYLVEACRTRQKNILSQRHSVTSITPAVAQPRDPNPNAPSLFRTENSHRETREVRPPSHVQEGQFLLPGFVTSPSNWMLSNGHWKSVVSPLALFSKAVIPKL